MKFLRGPANGSEERLEALLAAQERTNELLQVIADRLQPGKVKQVDLKEPGRFDDRRGGRR